MYHRTANVVVMNHKQEILVGKGIKGQTDTICFGDMVKPEEMVDMNISMQRILEQELGLPIGSKQKKEESFFSPEFVFKTNCADDVICDVSRKHFAYFYQLNWSQEHEMSSMLHPYNPKVESFKWMSRQEIQDSINEQKMDFTPESWLAIFKMMEVGEEIRDETDVVPGSVVSEVPETVIPDVAAQNIAIEEDHYDQEDENICGVDDILAMLEQENAEQDENEEGDSIKEEAE